MAVGVPVATLELVFQGLKLDPALALTLLQPMGERLVRALLLVLSLALMVALTDNVLIQLCPGHTVTVVEHYVP